jgi:hypothetical protein
MAELSADSAWPSNSLQASVSPAITRRFTGVGILGHNQSFLPHLHPETTSLRRLGHLFCFILAIPDFSPSHVSISPEAEGF